MDEFLTSSSFIIILTCIITVLVITVITLTVFLVKITGRLNRFMGVKSKRHNLEEILTDYYYYVETLDKRYESIEKNIDILFDRLRPCIQKIGIVRYNPFNNMGGDLSYAIALLDEYDNGFIINTIFSRDGSHTYCKPVESARSEYILSYEEEEAIKKALGIETRQKRGSDLSKVK